VKPGKISITLVRSGIGWPESQRKNLAGLGLKKLHKKIVRPDTPEIRGMINKVIHLVKVEKCK